MQEKNDKETNVEQFTDLISQYDKVMELDKELLNRLIDKIVVSDRIKVDDGYYQDDNRILCRAVFLYISKNPCSS
ncbi:MAG: DUF4368 domain-containing protein [Oscillospiraceae bacterium]|nr:DUF4368 domain-containing protein [Oscillospiraceae bacterium]